MKQHPIGIFDSGIGGLTILDCIRERMPNENILYYADTASCPYGEKSPQDILYLSERVVSELVERGAKMIVVACNTASTITSEELREKFSLPIVATEPAIRPAVEKTESGSIGVLATRSTIESGQIDRLAMRYGKGVRVITQAGHSLVDLVEEGKEDSKDVEELLISYLTPMVDAGCDYIVLGCTHYPFLRKAISNTLSKIGGNNIQILDTGKAVARQVERVLQENRLLNDQNKEGQTTFMSSAGNEDANRIRTIYKKTIIKNRF